MNIARLGNYAIHSLFLFSLWSNIYGQSLLHQSDATGYTQPCLIKTLEIIPPDQTTTLSVWVDQADSFSVTVSSLAKNLSIKLTDPLGVVYLNGQSPTKSFLSAIYPDPQVEPDATGAHYFLGLEAPRPGQWTLQVSAPDPLAIPLILPVHFAINNSVGPVLFGGGGSYPLGESLIFSTAVMDGLVKVANLQISAILFRLDDLTATPLPIMFTDDGQGADYAAGDAIYSTCVAPAQPGQYTLQVEVSGDASTGHFQRSISTGFRITPKTASITGNYTITPRVRMPK